MDGTELVQWLLCAPAGNIAVDLQHDVRALTVKSKLSHTYLLWT